MSIEREHPPLTVDGVVYDFAHLKAFSAAIPGKGVTPGTDLRIEVLFSNHVYTERAKHRQPHHTLDHHGVRRTFDGNRYEMSRMLPAAIAGCIAGNSLTHISRSYGGTDNLIFIETGDGRQWAVVYCLLPLEDGCSVRMDVLSCHPKVIDQKSISRRSLSYFVRMCIYAKARIPKT